MKLNIKDLLELNLENMPEDLRNKINILLSAVNDWPNEILSLEDYELTLRHFIEDDINKNTIENWLKTVDLLEHAWEVESLTELSLIFDFYKKKTNLVEVINDLKEKISDFEFQ